MYIEQRDINTQIGCDINIYGVIYTQTGCETDAIERGGWMQMAFHGSAQVFILAYPFHARCIDEIR